ncbi:MAG: hypothetical protein LBT62_06005, partial [Deltaproteobacteria bacterium]|nr:hypothetical protein [Deltaproteobacteria bacterium]
MKEYLQATLNVDALASKAAIYTPNVIAGPQGPGLMFRGVTIHSADDPLSEARNWLGQALSKRSRQKTQPPLALIFGLGLGWHIRAIKEIFPAIRVCVFEPDRSLFDVYSKYNVLALEQEPEIFTDITAFEEMVSAEIV